MAKTKDKKVPDAVIKQFAQGFTDPTGMLDFYRDPATGTVWQPERNSAGGFDGFTNYKLGADGQAQIGSNYDLYGSGGDYVGQRQFVDPGNGMRELAMGLAAAGGMYGLGSLVSGAGAGGVGSGAGFVGEGALSGVPAWDGALAGAGAGVPGTASMGAGAAGAGGAGSAAGGAGAAGSAGAGSLIPGISNSSLLGLGATAIGGLAGAKGQENSTTATRELPAYLQAPVGGLINQTSNLLNSQMAAGQQNGANMISAGNGLLGTKVAGNGVGLLAAPKNNVGDLAKVKLGTVNFDNNPYMQGVADDIQRRTGLLLSQNNQQIAGNAVASGSLGGSRQGLAQGLSAAQAADSMQGQLASLYNTAFENQSNRNLQQYGMDQNYNLGGRGQDIQLRGQDLSKYGMDQQFYGQQRGQDLQAVGLGADLVKQGTALPWIAPTAASGIYGQFANQGSTTNSSNSGGGWQGILGGALAGGSAAKQMGWW